MKEVIGDLTDKRLRLKGDDVEVLEQTLVWDDIITNGLPILNSSALTASDSWSW